MVSHRLKWLKKSAAPEVKKDKAATQAEKRELEKLPVMIEKLEGEQAAIYALMAEPGFYEKTPEEISAQKFHLELITDQLAVMYKRWEELEK